MAIDQSLIVVLLVIMGAKYIIINIQRANGYNVFPESKVINLILGVIIMPLFIKAVNGLLIKEQVVGMDYLYIFICIAGVCNHFQGIFHKVYIHVENIYKPELEDILKEAFRKRKLWIIEETSDEEGSVFLFLDPDIKSRILIKTSFYSTKKHDLIIEDQNDLSDLKEILSDMDAMIPPMARNFVVVKFLLKTGVLVLLSWKIAASFVFL